MTLLEAPARGSKFRRVAAPSMPRARRSTSERVREALCRPESYPHRHATVEVRETHISWVFLTGGRAYKLKMPLVLDFLD